MPRAVPRISTVTDEHNSPPFLKWAGGKQWLVPQLRSLLSLHGGKYIEPFLGGASVFLTLRPPNAWLSDTNRELIQTYRVVKKDAEGIIAILKGFSFTKRFYYSVRQWRPGTVTEAAARFIYLNRTCWNGLYRVNRLGAFNVPKGSFARRPDFVVAERLRAAHDALRHAHLSCQDFEAACQRAKPGDTIYLDPPYTMGHANNGFLRYNEKVFSWDDQQRLAKLAHGLIHKGCRVVISNADHPNIQELYPGFFITRVVRASRVAADSAKRRAVSELLITSFEPQLDHGRGLAPALIQVCGLRPHNAIRSHWPSARIAWD